MHCGPTHIIMLPHPQDTYVMLPHPQDTYVMWPHPQDMHCCPTLSTKQTSGSRRKADIIIGSSFKDTVVPCVTEQWVLGECACVCACVCVYVCVCSGCWVGVHVSVRVCVCACVCACSVVCVVVCVSACLQLMTYPGQPARYVGWDQHIC